MKYLFTVITIIIFFTGCQTKDIFDFGNNKKLKIFKHSEKSKTYDSNESYESEEEIESIGNNIVDGTIAFVYSSNKIGKYSIKVSNVASIYASADEHMSLKFLDMPDESINVISNTFNILRDNNITKVMLYITNANINNLYEYEYLNEFDIYLPLNNKIVDINASDVNINIDSISIIDESNNTQVTNKQSGLFDFLNDDEIEEKEIVYGSINYKNQFDSLIAVAKTNIVEIYDDSHRSLKLHETLKGSNITSLMLEGKYPNYKHFLNKNKNMLLNSTILLNIPIIKSSILLSQLTVNEDVNVTGVLSVQHNYTPTIFSLTQNNDINTLVLANSISKSNDKLESISTIFGYDIKYDWVNYSTLVGLEYLKHKKKNIFDDIIIENNTVIYPVKLLKVNNNSFQPYNNEFFKK